MEALTVAASLSGIPRGADFRKGATRMGVTSKESAVVAAADRVQAAPDGGKLTDLPPLVQWEMTAFLPTADTGTDAVRRGGMGEGSSCPLREPDRRPEERQSDLSMFFLWPWEPILREERGVTLIYYWIFRTPVQIRTSITNSYSIRRWVRHGYPEPIKVIWY
jgi:hypothetical protein